MQSIKQAREAAGWTQEQLAAKMDVTREYIAKWESGARNPSKRSLTALALVFGCSPESLTGDDALEIDQIKINSVARQTATARYADTNAKVMSQIPKTLIHELTAAQLVLVANAISAAFKRGFAAAGADYMRADGVLWVDGHNYDMDDIRTLKPIGR